MFNFTTVVFDGTSPTFYYTYTQFVVKLVRGIPRSLFADGEVDSSCGRMGCVTDSRQGAVLQWPRT